MKTIHKKTRQLILILFLFKPLNFYGQIDYFGETPPGNTPEIFAPDIISLPNRFEARLVYSPEGNELFFAVMNPTKGFMELYTSCKKDGEWTEPDVASFSGSAWDFEPCYSPDGNRLYFTSRRQTGNYHLWYVNRLTDTTWSYPAALPEGINTSSQELYSMPYNDTMFYFISARSGGYGGNDLYLAKYNSIDNFFNITTPPVNLGKLINTSGNEFDPCPGPDSEYLIFMRNYDLYITFLKPDNTYTNPRSMGSTVNTTFTEVGPVITPDKKYLMFTRFSNNNNGEIYWVSISVIDSLKTLNSIPYKNKNVKDTTFCMNEEFQFELPDSIFIDDDGNNTLTYQASLSNNPLLPDWLDFDPSTGIFSGLAGEEGTFRIKVTATDDENISVSALFNIIIEKNTLVNERAVTDYFVYPNPAHDQVFIQANDDGKIDGIRLSDIYGKELKVFEYFSAGHIDLGDLIPGIYFLKFCSKQKFQMIKLMVY